MGLIDRFNKSGTMGCITNPGGITALLHGCMERRSGWPVWVAMSALFIGYMYSKLNPLWDTWSLSRASAHAGGDGEKDF